MRSALTSILLVALLSLVNPTPSSGEAVRTQSHVPAEITLTAASVPPDASTLEVDAVITAPNGESLRVPAFWAGGSTWKFRYASSLAGTHTYLTEGPEDLGGVQGTIEVEPYSGDNPLFKHGPLRLSDDRRHLVHADGKEFFWLGDTWWMGLSKRLTWPEGFHTLAADRKGKGFTVIQIVGGLPPDMVPLDPRGEGDGGQAWTDDLSAIRPEFYNAADRRIQHLVEQGLMPCLVAAWKNYLPVLGPEKMKHHWRNLIARYGAYPVVWVVGGEINKTNGNPTYRGKYEPAMEIDEAAFRAGWLEVTEYLRETDPFGRIVGAHNQNDYRVLDDPALLDMYFLQSGHSALGSISAQIEWFADHSRASHRAPMILSEANYQGLFNEGSYDDQLQRHQFWVTFLEGGAGHTYGANGIWQVNQPGQPFGPSPHGFTWGNTPWPEAMEHAASQQLGHGKAFLETLPWTALVPASGQVQFAPPALPPIAETGAQWIWTSDGKSGDRVVGATFDLPVDATIRHATLRLACQARYGLSLNGQSVHRRTKLEFRLRHKHADAWLFPLAGEYLQPGRNILLLRLDKEDLVHGDGLLAHLRVELADGEIIDVVSDETWRWTNPKAGWPGDILKLDPASWETQVATVEGIRRELDFREIETYGPRCATVPGRLWLIYAPAALPVELGGLTPGAAFALELFDPRSGERSQPEPIRSDAFGRWRWEPPSERGDWVLLVRSL